MRKLFVRLGLVLCGLAVLLVAALAVRVIVFKQGISMHDFVAATDLLLVYVNNPDVPEPPPVDTGGGGGGGGGGGSSGGGGAGGAVVATTISPSTVKNTSSKKRGDINGDGKVNLIDFSILAYWYKRPLTAAAIQQGVDLSGDGKVTLADFSILAYYWGK